MLVARSIGPSFSDIRPLKPAEAEPSSVGRFPVYPDLVDRLADPEIAQPDPTIAHALAVCATYAYATVAGFCSEPDTLARMMARIGMPGNHTLMVADRVDVSFIVSNGFITQSADGRIAVLSYRGTEPFNPTNWLTDADLESEQVSIQVGSERLTVHPGFYRNVRATRSPLIEALDRADRGRSVLDEDSAMPNSLERLYITGHSLGGAMAALMGLLILNDPSYEHLAAKLAHVYTYGQPMVGPRSLAEEVADSGQASAFSRFVYHRDVVPHLPPWGLGQYSHFGREYRQDRDTTPWITVDPGSRQAPFASVALAPMQFLSRSLPLARHLWFPYSLSDHLPLNYIQWLSPPGVASEYGDYATELT